MRLRVAVGPFRYFCAGEYGERTGRPHYHLILFGYRPNDLARIGGSKTGHPIWLSEYVTKKWRKGTVYVQDFAQGMAQYVAQYTLKKQKKRVLDHETLAYMTERTPEMIRMSKGRQDSFGFIGQRWLERYYKDLENGFIWYDGKAFPIPKAYDKWLKKHQPDVLAKSKAVRQAAGELAEARFLENVPAKSRFEYLKHKQNEQARYVSSKERDW